jgi:hypothetical protein
MKTFLIIPFYLISFYFAQGVQAQNTTKPDYITSGYYQLVYEADIAHLEGNDDLAFEKLSEAEKCCPLLNQLMYSEMELYSSLLVKKRMFTQALYYAEKLATEYGSLSILFNDLEDDSLLLNELLVEYPAFIDSIVPSLLSKCDGFYTPEREVLLEELSGMCERDQTVRVGWETARKDSLEFAAVRQRMKQVDTENAKRIFEIIDQYGFPGLKLLGNKNPHLPTGIPGMFMHISDHEKIEDIILQFVRDGECPPDLYATIIDRKTMLVKGKKTCIYAAYSNTTDDQIIDIAHLDERRLSIGMPTREMEKKRKELFDKKHEE